MDKSQKKSRSPLLYFTAVFVVIIFITIINNRRSRVAAELSFPLNNGISSLSTCGNQLAAVSSDGTIYLWDWNDLSKAHREYHVDSEQTVLISPDKAVSLSKSGYVIVTSFDGDKKQTNIPMPFRTEEKFLAVNSDKNKIFLLLNPENTQGDAIKYNLFELDIDSSQLRPAVEFDSEQSNTGGISVSDDGRYIVGWGEKNKVGWLFVLDSKENKLKWQKQFPDFKKIFKAAFSTNGEFIYARGTDSTLLVINAGSGEEIRRLLPLKENKSTYKTQPAQTVTISEDGNLAAATVFGTVYVWDTKTNKLLTQLQPDHKVISSITFSGNSQFMATSDMRQGGKIEIFKIPQKK